MNKNENMNKNNDLVYREEILELYKNPINFGSLKNKTHCASLLNSSCGDEINVDLIIKKDIINDIKFNGQGCAISIAASSLLTQKVKKMNIKEVNNLTIEDVIKLLGITVNTGRIKCAMICLEAIKKAIEKKKK